jgi:hypothetical protein
MDANKSQLFIDTKKQKEVKEEKKMVKRSKKEFEQVDAFDGICEVAEIITGEFDGKETRQIHMAIKPLDKETIELLKDSKTHQMHNYISLSKKVKIDDVPEGSNLDKYIIEVETVFPEAKELDTFMKVFDMLKGKKIRYVYKKLGKAYKGYEGKSYYVPQSKL